MSTTTRHGGENEVTILARFLGNGDGPLPTGHRAIADLEIGDRDKARMHELAVLDTPPPEGWGILGSTITAPCRGSDMISPSVSDLSGVTRRGSWKGRLSTVQAG